MPKQQAPIHYLQQFLPPGTYDAVMQYLHYYKVHLTVARERKSILGDYRHRTHHDNHRISVNGNLNVYAFLITLLHELGHLLTFEKFGNSVQSHGREWKIIYGRLLHQFLENKVFPPEIENELQRSLANPAATSCAEDRLIRVLRKFDKPALNNFKMIEEIPLYTIFKTDGRLFKKGEKVRKRFRCTEVETGRIFLFSPVYEVEIINTE